MGTISAEIVTETWQCIGQFDVEDVPDLIPIRDEYRGIAFVHLKILLDAFIDSLV